MDVGGELKRARMRKHLSLTQLADSTKIKVSTLEALERNDFERLPAEVYLRGFVRAYAREAGLDANEIVEQYLAQAQQAPPIVFEPAAPAPAPRVMRAAAPGTSDVSTTSRPSLNFDFGQLRRLPPAAMAGAAVVLVLLAYFTFASRDKNATAQASAPPSAPAGDPAPAAAAATSSPDAAHAANVAPDSLRVELKATGACWVSASADRKPVLSRLLQAGEAQAFEAKDEFVLRVGDPGTIAVVINGLPARPLGPARQPITVQIRKDNYREFLTP